MNMVDKVVNDNYYGKIDTEKVGWRRLYYLYAIFFFIHSFLFLELSGVSN